MPTAEEVWRDYVTAGVPASGVHQPAKADIRSWAAGITEVLTVGRTYHVSPTGSDSNTGLSTGESLATIQAAVDKFNAINSGGFATQVQLADGTYTLTNPIQISRPLLGSSRLIIRGNPTTPANVLVRKTTAGTMFSCAAQTHAGFVGLKTEFESGVSGAHILAQGFALAHYSNMDFGNAGASPHILLSGLGRCTIDSDYTISGSAAAHIRASGCSEILGANRTVTLTGTPAFSTAFVDVSVAAAVQLQNFTFSGAATGKRYQAVSNGVINAYGAATTLFPGDAVGTTATGGQYV